MTCPNSTESGCRCPEHHPGLGLTATRSVSLQVVTAGPRALSQTEALDQLLVAKRAGCPACQGDRDRCNNGTGPPHFERLAGCAAFKADGQIAKQAKARPRQPWEPRPSRAA